MLYITGLLLAILVGVTLGMVGSGGSILTVPILVYIFGINPVLATTYSLLIIGFTSLIGAVNGMVRKNVDYQKIIYFGIPSMVTVFIVRQFILPLIPKEFVFWGHIVHQEKILMLLFAAVMILSSIQMINNKVDNLPMRSHGTSLWYVFTAGIVVGFITGVVGAGGGFLIIPVLINNFGIDFKKAVNTSLLIIAINSLMGLLGDLEKLELFDWEVVIFYITLSIIGLFIGFKVSTKIKNSTLKRILGIGILCLSIVIIINELFI